MNRRLPALVAAIALTLAGAVTPALAVNPDEMLKNPVLEARARAISGRLRCLVCQNESIDISDADLARDLRLLVRKRLVAGDTDKQVIDYLVARYGEFVLLKPRFEARTVFLWGTPIIVLVCGAGAMAAYAATRRRRQRPAPLSVAEQAELDAVLASDAQA